MSEARTHHPGSRHPGSLRRVLSENIVLSTLGPARSARLSRLLVERGLGEAFPVKANTLVISDAAALRRLAAGATAELAAERRQQARYRVRLITYLRRLIAVEAAEPGAGPGELEATLADVEAIDTADLDGAHLDWVAIGERRGPPLAAAGFHEVAATLYRQGMLSRTSTRVVAELLVGPDAPTPESVLLLSGEAASTPVPALPLVEVTPAAVRSGGPLPAMAVLSEDSALYLRWRADVEDAAARWSDTRLIRGQLVGVEVLSPERGAQLTTAVTENPSWLWVVPVIDLKAAAEARGLGRLLHRGEHIFQSIAINFTASLSATLQQITIDQRAAFIAAFEVLHFERDQLLYGADEPAPGLYLVGGAGGVTVERSWPEGLERHRLRETGYGDALLPVADPFSSLLQYGDLFGVKLLEEAGDRVIRESATVRAGTALYFLPAHRIQRLMKALPQVEALLLSLTGLARQLPIAVASLCKEAVFNGYEPGRVAVALMNGQFIQWRVGAPPPSPLGHAQGLGVILDGELVGVLREQRGSARYLGAVTDHVQIYANGAVFGSVGLGLAEHFGEDRMARLPTWILFMSRALLVGVLGGDFERASVELFETFAAQAERNEAYMADRHLWVGTAADKLPDVVLVTASAAARSFCDVHDLLRQLGETMEVQFGETSRVVAVADRERVNPTSGGCHRVAAQEELQTLLLRMATQLLYLGDRGISTPLSAGVASLASDDANKRGWRQERDALSRILTTSLAAVGGCEAVDRVFLLMDEQSPLTPGHLQALTAIVDHVLIIESECGAPLPFPSATMTPYTYTAVRRFENNRLSGPLGHRFPPASVRVGLDASRQPDEASLRRWARAVTNRRVGIALGGGGAWGMAHVAVLRAIHHAGIPIDMIAGSSVGCSVGAFYCALGLEGLDRFLDARVKLQLGFLAGAVTSTIFARIVRDLLGDYHLEQLRIPFLPVTSDLSSASERTLLFGDVADAARKSGSLAPLYPPTPIEGAILVDGGITRNLPVSVLELEGARLIAASNIVPPPAYEPPKRVSAPGSLGMVLHDLNPAHRLNAAAKSALTLFYSAGNSTSEGAAVTFESQWTGTLPLDMIQGPRIIRDIQSTPGFWQSVSGLRERWQLLKEPNS